MTMPSLAVAPTPEPPADLAGAYQEWLAATGRGCRSLRDGARRFLRRWPDPQAWADEPLDDRLAAGSATRAFITFLMLHGWLRPGLDWLVRRKIPYLVRYGTASPLAADIARYQQAAVTQGFSDHIIDRSCGRVIIRLLIQTGRRLDALSVADLDAIEAAFIDRAEQAGIGWHNDRALLHAAHTVLFHLEVVDTTAPNRRRCAHDGYEQRFYEVTPALVGCLVAYLAQLAGTHARSTISGTATRLADFARVLTRVDPELVSLADLDRRRHIEPYLAAVAAARRTQDGKPISLGERRNRIISVARFLADIAEWGWDDAPPRRLIFPRDAPRPPRTLPRYLPPDVDRRLVAALEDSANRLFADALLLARATGLRVGEVVGLELDCVHEIPGHGAWLKVPADNHCDSERMLPIDQDTLAIVDRIAALRSPGRPLPHPRTGRPTDFLLTRHGKRVSVQALRDELARVAEAASIGHVTPHQLRHTYATALVNAGVPLQALMALLGHVSAAMSLRYAKLFDATVRADYERALTLTKTRLGPVLPQRASLPLAELPGHHGDWRDTDTVKGRLAGGYCLRTAAQGVCPYTNICEHCPNFRTEASFLPILAAQRADADALAADAEARGWDTEATRHRELVARLDALIDKAEAG